MSNSESNSSKSDPQSTTPKRRRSRRRRSRQSSSNGSGDGKATQAQSSPQSGQDSEPRRSEKTGKSQSKRRRRRNRQGDSDKGKQKTKNTTRSGESSSEKGSRSKRPRSHPPSKASPEKFGGRGSRSAQNGHRGGVPQDEQSDLDAFELFCAYHLGITEHNTYRQQKVSDIARRFNVSKKDVISGLENYGLDRASVKDSPFDFALARLDIRVAPEGIDRRELAKVLYAEFLEVTPEIPKKMQSIAGHSEDGVVGEA